MGCSINRLQASDRCQIHNKDIIAICLHEDCKLSLSVNCESCLPQLDERCLQSLLHKREFQKKLLDLKKVVETFLRSKPQLNQKQIDQMRTIVVEINRLLKSQLTKEQWMQGYRYLMHEEYILSLTKFPQQMNSLGISDRNRRMQKSDELFCCAKLKGQCVACSLVDSYIVIEEFFIYNKYNIRSKKYKWDPIQPYNKKAYIQDIQDQHPAFKKLISTGNYKFSLHHHVAWLYLHKLLGGASIICQSNVRKFAYKNQSGIHIFSCKTLNFKKSIRDDVHEQFSHKIEYSFGEKLIAKTSDNNSRKRLIIADLSTGKKYALCPLAQTLVVLKHDLKFWFTISKVRTYWIYSPLNE